MLKVLRATVTIGLVTALTITVRADRAGQLLWDNGDPDDAFDGHSNAVEGVFGSRRTLLDDFVVPAAERWWIERLHHWHFWNSLPPGSGVGMELAIRSDAGGAPGPRLCDLMVIAYEESGTGRIRFGRPEAESFTHLEPVELGPGRWWFEATVVGPENNFWVSRESPPVIESQEWVNYEDLGGLQPSSDIFGVPGNLMFQLIGAVACASDIDDSGEVDFGDVLALLAAWGPCPDTCICPEDLDHDAVVGFADLVILLEAWGEC